MTKGLSGMAFWNRSRNARPSCWRGASPSASLVVAFASVGAIWVAEYFSGPELGVSIFYIIPIALVVWRPGGVWSVVMPSSRRELWLTAELAAGRPIRIGKSVCGRPSSAWASSSSSLS